MEKAEKYLLLETVMRDMRNSFPENIIDERINLSISLAEELYLQELATGIKQWTKSYFLDGKFFQNCDFNYYVIREMHNLGNNYKGRSVEFLEKCFCLKYLEYAFDDADGMTSFKKYYQACKNSE